jgi:hypothetical protein
MLAGPGLATAQKLADAGWVGVGALPLMVLDGPDLPDVDGAGVRALTEVDLHEARALLADTYSMSDAAAAAAVPLPGRGGPRPRGVGAVRRRLHGVLVHRGHRGRAGGGVVQATRPHDRSNAAGYHVRRGDRPLPVPERRHARGELIAYIIVIG